MEKYLGVKLIEAEPAMGYNGKLYTFASPAGVETEDGYKVVYEDGYTSWSPKDVFEKAYRKVDGLTFGLAIEAAKLGKKVCRKGWNGSGMYAYIVPAAGYPAQTEIAKAEFGSTVPYRSYWALKTAQGDVATWAPSGSDSLAEDWEIIK